MRVTGKSPTQQRLVPSRTPIKSPAVGSPPCLTGRPVTRFAWAADSSVAICCDSIMAFANKESALLKAWWEAKE
jgi:hypothetical protein